MSKPVNRIFGREFTQGQAPCPYCGTNLDIVGSGRPMKYELKPVSPDPRIPFPIMLTREEAEELSSLVVRKVGMITYQGSVLEFNGKKVTSERQAELDRAWTFWNTIGKKISASFGFQNWMTPSKYAAEEVDYKVQKAILELDPNAGYKIEKTDKHLP